MQKSSPPEATAPPFDIVDIPQADDLDTVRTVVAAVASGNPTRAAVQEVTGYTERHMQYRVRAAVILGLLEEDAGLSLTSRGRAFLDRPARSDDERRLLREAVASVEALHDIAPQLFGTKAPKRPWIAKRLTSRTLMAQSTALRRATTLLCWRRRLLPRQLNLFDEVWGVAPEAEAAESLVAGSVVASCPA